MQQQETIVHAQADKQAVQVIDQLIKEQAEAKALKDLYEKQEQDLREQNNKEKQALQARIKELEQADKGAYLNDEAAKRAVQAIDQLSKQEADAKAMKDLYEKQVANLKEQNNKTYQALQARIKELELSAIEKEQAYIKERQKNTIVAPEKVVQHNNDLQKMTAELAACKQASQRLEAQHQSEKMDMAKIREQINNENEKLKAQVTKMEEALTLKQATCAKEVALLQEQIKVSKATTNDPILQQQLAQKNEELQKLEAELRACKEASQKIKAREIKEGIKPDGNCLFRSLGYGIFGNQDIHATIRQIITDYQKANNIPFTKDAQNRDVNMTQDACWGGELEMCAAQKIWSVRIFVIVYQNGQPVQLKKINDNCKDFDAGVVGDTLWYQEEGPEKLKQLQDQIKNEKDAIILVNNSLLHFEVEKTVDPTWVIYQAQTCAKDELIQQQQKSLTYQSRVIDTAQNQAVELLDKAYNENETLKAQIKELQETTSAEIKELQTRVQEATEKARLLEQDREQTQMQVAEIERLRTQLATCTTEQEADKKKSALDEIQQAQKSFKRSDFVTREECDTLREEIDEMMREKLKWSRTQDELAVCEERATRIQQSLDIQSEKFESDVKTWNEQKEKMALEIEQLRAIEKNTSMRSSKIEINQTIENLQKEIRQRDEQIQAQAKQLSDISQELELQRQKDILATTNQVLTAAKTESLAALSAREAQLEQKIESLKSKQLTSDVAADLLKASNGDVSVLEELVTPSASSPLSKPAEAAIDQVCQKYIEEARAYKELEETLRQQIAALESKYKNKITDFEMLQADASALRETMQTLQADIQTCEDNKISLEAQVASLQQELAKLTTVVRQEPEAINCNQEGRRVLFTDRRTAIIDRLNTFDKIKIQRDNLDKNTEMYADIGRRISALQERIDQEKEAALVAWLQDTEKLSNSEECAKLDALQATLAQIESTWRSIEQEIADLNEDVMGAVRVYVRVRGGVKNNSFVDVANDQDIVTAGTCGGAAVDKTSYPSFYAAFNKDATNQDIFESHFVKLFDQLARGYQLILFGYGYSGSGKTYTLLGNSSSQGMTQLGLMYLKSKYNATIELFDVFELYARLSTNTQDVNKPYVGQKIYLYDASDINNKIENKIESILMLPQNVDNINDLQNTIKTIAQHRLDKDRIRATPNNPESSRSHLFMRFRCTFPDGVQGVFTIVDAGGQESPVDIANQMLERKIGQKFKANDVPPLLRALTYGKESAYQPKGPQTRTSAQRYESAVKTVREGFYINETLNHLRWFLLQKQGISTDSKPTNRFRNEGENVYDPQENFVDPATDKTVLIKQVLDDMYEPGKTKFVMVAALNPDADEKHCSSSLKTLEYAQSIKST